MVHTPCQKPHLHYQSLLLGLISALIITIFGSIIFTHTKSTTTASSATTSLEDLSCGNSVAEAISLGCEFDLVSVQWTPVTCIDKTSNAEFEDWLGSSKRTRPWPFWLDENATTQLSSTYELSTHIGETIWTTAEYHIGHCGYEFRRLQRAMVGDAYWKSYMRNDSHTLHCLHTMLGPVNFHNVDTHFKVRLGKC